MRHCSILSEHNWNWLYIIVVVWESALLGFFLSVCVRVFNIQIKWQLVAPSRYWWSARRQRVDKFKSLRAYQQAKINCIFNFFSCAGSQSFGFLSMNVGKLKPNSDEINAKRCVRVSVYLKAMQMHEQCVFSSQKLSWRLKKAWSSRVALCYVYEQENEFMYILDILSVAFNVLNSQLKSQFALQMISKPIFNYAYLHGICISLILLVHLSALFLSFCFGRSLVLLLARNVVSTF